jgi:hypothetical protein
VRMGGLDEDPLVRQICREQIWAHGVRPKGECQGRCESIPPSPPKYKRARLGPLLFWLRDLKFEPGQEGSTNYLLNFINGMSPCHLRRVSVSASLPPALSLVDRTHQEPATPASGSDILDTVRAEPSARI